MVLCGSCKTDKPDTDFYPCYLKSKRHYCKGCITKYRKNWLTQNLMARTTLRAAIKRYNHKNPPCYQKAQREYEQRQLLKNRTSAKPYKPRKSANILAQNLFSKAVSELRADNCPEAIGCMQAVNQILKGSS